MDKILKNIFIDTRLESYRNFFRDDWAQRIDALIADSPKLQPLVFDLIMDWRSAS